ncbi:MAG TPA: hypothetical protein VMT35_04915 [Ignavibacteriaceae bacterium]|nr:hypothetical protein [Ignavibacteriaceae bacterium]
MYDIADPKNLSLVSSFSYKYAVHDYDKEMNKVINIGNLCFMFTSYYGVSIYDISDPSEPQYLSYLQKEDGTPNTASSIAKIKDSIYYLITGLEIAIYNLSNLVFLH